MNALTDPQDGKALAAEEIRARQAAKAASSDPRQQRVAMHRFYTGFLPS